MIKQLYLTYSLNSNRYNQSESKWTYGIEAILNIPQSSKTGTSVVWAEIFQKSCIW